MAQQSLNEMAELIGRQQAAKRHLAEFDALMENLRPRFARRGDRPLLMITLLDPRHVRFSAIIASSGGARSPRD